MNVKQMYTTESQWTTDGNNTQDSWCKRELACARSAAQGEC